MHTSDVAFIIVPVYAQQLGASDNSTQVGVMKISRPVHAKLKQNQVLHSTRPQTARHNQSSDNWCAADVCTHHTGREKQPTSVCQTQAEPSAALDSIATCRTHPKPAKTGTLLMYAQAIPINKHLGDNLYTAQLSKAQQRTAPVPIHQSVETSLCVLHHTPIL